MANIVFIATSLDGFIADKKNSLDWLHSISNPTNDDMGFFEHMERVDALVMGRNTLDLVISMEVDWPYSKPVFVLSHTMTSAPEGYEDKVSMINGELKEIVQKLKALGFSNLYVDGGLTIQSFLKEDLIDEMIISTIPILLGGGIPLFGSLAQPLKFKHIRSECYIDAIVQSKFVRQRD